MTIAIGNPLGQDRTVTTGIISAIGRTIAEETSNYQIGGAIQTDAAINPGNSGGPLLNSSGQVIGMNTAILSQSGASSGIGFAVPVNLIKKVSQALISQGKYDHPYLGVGLRDVTTLDARQNNLPSAGILIAPNGSDSPVAQAGLNGQAILVAINGTQVTSSEEVIAFLELKTKPGDTVTLTVVGSNGQKQDLAVKLGARPNVADRTQP
jgi:2-alkenal reductase